MTVHGESVGDRPADRSGDPADLAQRVADAATGVDGVADLHGGVFGEIATYLPGGRVSGVQLSDGRGEVHVIVDIDHDLRAVAAQVARVASDVAAMPIDVTVEDVSIPGVATEQSRPAGPDGSSGRAGPDWYDRGGQR
ncbi:hypothetical protein ACPXB3_08785 [Gordonia sp. DT219]|uniref:hypothetical protein n=1 Tax=Gordonia sp. DT219 TaxID=3416658 RepID=UPI003CF0262F